MSFLLWWPNGMRRRGAIADVIRTEISKGADKGDADPLQCMGLTVKLLEDEGYKKPGAAGLMLHYLFNENVLLVYSKMNILYFCYFN